MVWFVPGLRSWVLTLPLVALPLACGDDPAPSGGTNNAAAAGSAGRAGAAGSAGRASGQGGAAGEGPTGAGQAGDDRGGEAGEMQGVGGSSGTVGTGGRGGKGGAAGAMSDGGTMSAGGSNAEGGAAAAGGEDGEGGAAAVGGLVGVGGGGGTAGDVGGTAGDSAGVGGTAGDSAGVGGTAATSGAAGTAGSGGADCDDSMAIPAGEACYTGAPGTRGVGICRDGLRFCTNGPCVGDVTPAPEACNREDDDCDGTADEDFGVFTCGVGACATSTDACVEGTIDQCTYRRQTSTDGCNGIDDDCDGGIDEDCPGTCVRVALTGDDAAATASNGATPFRNVQPAIDFASSTPSAPKHVCIASGATCTAGVTATYAGPPGAPLTMRNGVHVTGRYETTGWTRCRNGLDVKTILEPATSVGLLFPSSILDRTIAFGLHVNRAALPTSAAVTVDGAENVLLASVITGGPSGTSYSYGVHVINGADVHLFQSGAYGGAGSVESIGLHVVGARALLEESGAGAGGTGLLGAGIGVLFDSAPGSRITGSSVSAGGGEIQSDALAVVVTGDATGVVVDHSTVSAFHPRTYEDYGAVGVAAYDCGAAEPWITTSSVTSNGRFADEGYSYAVHADGCSARIDQNASIRSFREGYTSYGVLCTSPGASKGCIVAGNLSISGDSWGEGGTVVNVSCSGCARVTRNTIVGRLRGSQFELPSGASDCQTTRCGRTVSGVRGGRFIDLNDIVAGCSLVSTGISGGGRISGNTVRGHTIEDCARSGPSTSDPLIPSAVAELGVSGGLYYENNSIVAAALDPRYIETSGTFRAANASGYVYLNNSFGVWNDTDTVFVEGTTPRRFERNRLSGLGGEYYDLETATTLTTAAQINALTDMISIGNTVN